MPSVSAPILVDVNDGCLLMRQLPRGPMVEAEHDISSVQENMPPYNPEQRRKTVAKDCLLSSEK